MSSVAGSHRCDRTAFPTLSAGEACKQDLLIGGMDFVRLPQAVAELEPKPELELKLVQPPPPHPDAFVVTVRPLAAWVRLDVHSAIWTASRPPEGGRGAARRLTPARSVPSSR
jgi:hypothetical protein